MENFDEKDVVWHSGCIAHNNSLDIERRVFPGGARKRLYLEYCASCHGQLGQGDGRVAKYLTPKPADLTRLSETNGGRFPAERVFEIIDGRREVEVHGSREMPVWGRTTRLSLATVQSRIRAIVNYLATLQGK